MLVFLFARAVFFYSNKHKIIEDYHASIKPNSKRDFVNLKSKTELLFEGSYLSFKRDQNYAREDFKLVKQHDPLRYLIFSEILSKINSQDNLKINVKYEFDQHFLPIFLQIEKSISNKYVLETFSIDQSSQTLNYKLQTSKGSQEFKKALPPKFHLSSPAFSSSMIWTENLNISEEKALSLISSSNEWTYSTPPAEKKIIANLEKEQVEDYKLNNIPLLASLWKLSSQDSNEEPPLLVYTGKDFSIPYELQSGDLRIILSNLIRHS